MGKTDHMKARAVIFDMDGVLVDSYDAHFESWKRPGAEHGLTMTEEQFAGTFGRTSADIIQYLWPGQCTSDDVAAWDDRKEALYREVLRAHFPAMDGASELLAALHEAGYAMAIGSSGPPENVQLVLDSLPGAEHITASVTGKDVTNGKPDPQVFLIAAKKLGVEPIRCAVLEDAPAGVQAARRANMAAVALTGTADRQTLAADADVVVESLRELTPQSLAALIDDRGE